MLTLTVSNIGDHRGEYKSIQDAIYAIPDDFDGNVKIMIYDGIYHEKLWITRSYLTLEGESCDKTIITYEDYAKMKFDNKESYGTFRTATVMIDTHDFIAKNITFQNMAGPGGEVGQAIALYVDGNYVEFYNCKFLGFQDTLFTAPLPPNPLLKNGFAGPKENAPRLHGKHYYKNCYIEGTIDFIFGGATAYFDHCEIFSKNEIRHGQKDVLDQETSIKGYITAASTPIDCEYGYVFCACKFTSDCPPESVYLGRPWRNFAKVILIGCELGEHIKEEGWHDWNKYHARDTVFFAEYESTGKGSYGLTCGKRVPWSKQLTQEEVNKFSKKNVYR